MRAFHIAVIVVFAAAVIIFAAQNAYAVSVEFFNLGTSMPLALVVIIAYLLGTLTGGSVAGFLRRTIRAARRRPDAEGPEPH